MSSAFLPKMQPNNIFLAGFKLLIVVLVNLTLQVVTNSYNTSNFSKDASTKQKGIKLMVFDIVNSEILLFSDNIYSAQGAVRNNLQSTSN